MKKTTYQNSWEAAKAVLRKKFVSLNAYIRKKIKLTTKLLSQDTKERRAK